MAALFTLALTLYLVLKRPRNLDAGIAAMLGATVALALGVVTPTDFVTVAALVWNATTALIAILIISALLDEAGFFHWIALHLARRAGGNGRTIFFLVIMFAASVSALFTNDSTVLILTPIVYELLRALGFSQRSMIPYLMACGFVADTMSLPLPVSNLTNIIATDCFHLPFDRYVVVMALPSLASLLTSAAALFWYYRREIPPVYFVTAIPQPSQAIRDSFLFWAGMGVMLLMGLTFLFGHNLGIPVATIMGGGAVLLLAGTRVQRVVRPWPVLRRAPWTIVLFAAGMYLVVYGVGKAGMTRWLADHIAYWAASGPDWTIWFTGTATAVLSSLLNNLPGLLLVLLALGEAPVPESLREVLVYAAVVGSDIGPKLTPIGSLATLIWLYFLRTKGLEISWATYCRAGLTLTAPVLAATLAALCMAARRNG
jgi:arsenical pump membrane protein